MLARILFQKPSQIFLDLLFPPRCVNCNRASSWLCEDCLARIALLPFAVCRRCGYPIAAGADSVCRQCHHHPLQAIDGMRAVAYFEDNPIRPAIHALKYRNRKVLAAPLGRLLAEACQRYHLAAEALVPVPLHPARLRQRGYNQSELLAGEAGRLLGLPVRTAVLQRRRNTRSQMTLGGSERYLNVANAFACASQELAGKSVLLIDDVCTTGSTLDACAVALKEGGAASVWGLTLARAR